MKTYKLPKREAGSWGALKSLLRRQYTDIRAVDGVQYAIEKGELVGYIGPNGAGKSTTVKLLSGILVPDSGDCQVLDCIPWKNRISIARRIGVVFGQRTQLWWDLPVIESFELLRDIYRVEPSIYRNSLGELTERLELRDLYDVPVRQLSLGQRMRCDLAASLLHRPELLFLDEPTIGLDAISKLSVRQFVRELNRDRGVTVLLTTHDMDDVEALCQRVLVIDQGKIFLDGTIDELRQRVMSERRLIVDSYHEGQHIEDEALELISVQGTRAHFRFDPERVAASALVGRVSARYGVRDLLIEKPPIEEIVAQLYRKRPA